MTYDEIIAQSEFAYIAVNQDGFITEVNPHFTTLLGWTDELVGKPLTTIVPTRMKDAHHLGFSRFVMTGEPHLLETDVTLPTSHRSGDTMDMVHHIAASNASGEWRFVSMIREPK